MSQKFWESPEAFKKGSNNYYNWWLNYPKGIEMRETAPFQRFINKYPRFSQRLIEEVNYAFRDRLNELDIKERLPWDDLYVSAKKIFESLTKEDLKVEYLENTLSDKLRFIKG